MILCPSLGILSKGDNGKKEIKIETELYSAVFTTKGGTIKKWALKQHSDQSKEPISLLPPDTPIPPVFVMFEGQLKDLPAKVNYTAEPQNDSVVLDGNNRKYALSFLYADPSGVSIRKDFTFYYDSYKVDVTTDVKGVPSYYVALGSKFGIYNEKGEWVHVGPVLLRDSEKIDIDKDNVESINFIQRFLGKESRNELTYQGNVRWIAQEDNYFAAALSPVNVQNDARIWKWTSQGDGQKQGVEIAYKVTAGKADFLLYAGPKRMEILEELGIGLEHIIDFGFFSIIARPLFWLLKYLYQVLGNYGWAIVVLTILVRIPFIPLLNKSQKSMKKMQDIQPHMAAIKEQFKKDPQRMQKEIMELYKKHKVNPVGGCLPMLIQLPVFFALYKILLVSIELQGAPFILWIHDLSLKDPYYVMPILMGIT
ncbi:MAG: membrane protein insertase YidC, partial [Nitrospirae bacterium]|nr:membrane protein insertase YidC [Nitrospirota bacterium]